MSPGKSHYTAEPNPFGWMSSEMASAFALAAAKTRNLASTPASWLLHALATGDGNWHSGESGPPIPGNYERLFADGAMVQQWDGESWRSKGAGMPHWRQIGDYPCWRVCTETTV